MALDVSGEVLSYYLSALLLGFLLYSVVLSHFSFVSYFGSEWLYSFRRRETRDPSCSLSVQVEIGLNERYRRTDITLCCNTSSATPDCFNSYFTMAPSDQGHRRTPLRRISHGSLSNLARSASQHPSESDPTRLNFLLPAFSDLADEMASLHANLEKLNDLSYVLETFNESFASYLYALRMNAFCVEWEQVRGLICQVSKTQRTQSIMNNYRLLGILLSFWPQKRVRTGCKGR